MVGVGAGVVGVGAGVVGVGVGAVVAGAVGVGAGVVGPGVGAASATTAADAAFEDTGGTAGVGTKEDRTGSALFPDISTTAASIDAFEITGPADTSAGPTVAAAGTPAPDGALSATNPSATAEPADETRTSVVAAMATQVETRMRPLLVG